MDLPNDLVSLHEAAAMIERSPRTIRRWITEGKLERFEGQPPDTGGSAPALVSRSSVLGLVVVKGQQPRVEGAGQGVTQEDDPAGHRAGGAVDARSDTTTSSSAAAVELVRLRGELEREKVAGELARATAERDAMRLQLQQLERRAADEAADLRAARDDWRERHDAVRAELDALRAVVQAEHGVPWWRKLLGGPVAALPGDDGDVPQAK